MLHETINRLLRCATERTADTRKPVKTIAQIAKRLNVSTAVMTNWKTRGISKQGALDAEREFGCSAQYVLTGEGPPSVHSAAEPHAPYRSAREQPLSSLIMSLGASIDGLSPGTRKAASALLEQVTQDPSSAAAVALQLEALIAAAKRQMA